MTDSFNTYLRALDTAVPADTRSAGQMDGAYKLTGKTSHESVTRTEILLFPAAFRCTNKPGELGEPPEDGHGGRQSGQCHGLCLPQRSPQDISRDATTWELRREAGLPGQARARGCQCPGPSALALQSRSCGFRRSHRGQRGGPRWCLPSPRPCSSPVNGLLSQGLWRKPPLESRPL